MIAQESTMVSMRSATSLKMKDRKFISEKLLLTADLLELWTGSETEAMRYRTCATLLRQAPELLGRVPSIDELSVLQGVSATIWEDAVSLLTTGNTALLQRLIECIPGSVREMLALQGLGPKRLRVVWKEMGITDITTLAHAVTENQLLDQKGFGPKTQEKVRQSLAHARCNGTSFLLSDLRPLAVMLEHELRELLGEEARFDFTGEYRRGCAMCSGIELIAFPSITMRSWSISSVVSTTKS